MLDCFLPLLVAFVCTIGFWHELVSTPDAWKQDDFKPVVDGAGLIGSDTYNYYFPMKRFYSEGLRNGKLRLWNPYIGFGVPVLGESQTGATYPVNLILYSQLDLNTAYNASILLHYVLAIWFTYFLARTCGIRRSCSYIAAIVFVFGWFPPRVCLEWAIVTGTWVPLLLAGLIGILKTGLRRYHVLVWFACFMQLTAGHYQLAFIGMLAGFLLTILLPVHDHSKSVPYYSLQHWKRKLFAWSGVLIGVVTVLPLLIDTWRLKSISQRDAAAFADSVRDYNVPYRYLIAQCFSPHQTYFPSAEASLNKLGGGNMIEAHLYAGTFALIVLGLSLAVFVFRNVLPIRISPTASKSTDDDRNVTTSHFTPIWIWFVLCLLGILLAEGSVVEYLKRLPGFSWFRYPGRYGMIFQLSLGLAIAQLLSILFSQRVFLGSIFSLVLCIGMLWDYETIGKQVQVVHFSSKPPIHKLNNSPVLELLKPTDRVFATMPNLLTLGDTSCFPMYLGLAPNEYLKLQESFPDLTVADRIPKDELDRLIKIGVTHILAMQQYRSDEGLSLVWSGIDPFLHSAMSRSPDQLFYLYRIDNAWGRVFLIDEEEKKVNASLTLETFETDEILITCECSKECFLIVTDLFYRGWIAEVDDSPVEIERFGFFRKIPLNQGSHRVRLVYRHRWFGF